MNGKKEQLNIMRIMSQKNYQSITSSFSIKKQRRQKKSQILAGRRIWDWGTRVKQPWKRRIEQVKKNFEWDPIEKMGERWTGGQFTLRTVMCHWWSRHLQRSRCGCSSTLWRKMETSKWMLPFQKTIECGMVRVSFWQATFKNCWKTGLEKGGWSKQWGLLDSHTKRPTMVDSANETQHKWGFSPTWNLVSICSHCAPSGGKTFLLVHFCCLSICSHEMWEHCTRHSWKNAPVHLNWC